MWCALYNTHVNTSRGKWMRKWMGAIERAVAGLSTRERPLLLWSVAHNALMM